MSAPALLLATGFSLLLSVTSAPSNAPWKNWVFCKKPDPNENSACLIKAIRGVEKDLVDGSSYFGLPKMNPLRIEKLSLYQASSASSVAVNISFTNCEVNGLLGWDLSSAKANWDEGTLTGIVSFSDQVIFDADYEVNGKVILVPVKGKGKAHITFDEMVSDIEIKGKTMSKKGKKYFSVDTFKVNMRPKSAKFHFTDPLRGNTPLGESINRALTENWREIMEDVKGPIGEGLGAAFKQTANRVFAKIPLDVLVPN